MDISRLDQARAHQIASFQRELTHLRRNVDAKRGALWPAAASLPAWQRAARVRLRALLGWPVVGGVPPRQKSRWQSLGRDRQGEIHLVRFGVTGGYTAFAVLFSPRHRQSAPLFIAQHGGLGTVEKIAGLGTSTSNYHNLVSRLRRRGCAVLVPQLPMWNDHAQPPFNQDDLEPHLRLLGASFPALNVLTLQRALDAALARPELRGAPVGLAGLSYGGCVGLYAAALDVRIRALLTSCFFNDRHAYPMPPSVPPGAAHSFLDAELGALVCPRPLWIEVATKDELFATKGARREAGKLRQLYRARKSSGQFHYCEFNGTHEFNRADTGLDFLVRSLIQSA